MKEISIKTILLLKKTKPSQKEIPIKRKKTQINHKYTHPYNHSPPTHRKEHQPTMKTALILSGGGARGAYQVGVIKALSELGIKCDIALGTSIGSINAAFYTTGDIDKAISLWKKININTVFAEPIEYTNPRKLMFKYLKKARQGGLEPVALRQELQKHLNLDALYQSTINYGLTTVKYPQLTLLECTKKDIPQSQLIDYILASCTVFPIFKLQNIDNANYIDGGFKESVPYEFAKNLGATKFIVVNISVLKRKFELPDTENLIFIKPTNKLGNPLVFDSQKAIRNIKYGYNDTMKKFNKYDGHKYTFRDLQANFTPNQVFKTFPEYLKTIEYLGTLLQIDDSKVYTQRIFNHHLKVALKNHPKATPNHLKHHRTIKRYRKLLQANRKIAIKYRNRDYLAAHYLNTFLKKI